MFKSLLSKLGLCREKKLQTLGSGLKALKKHFGVIGENQGKIGQRVYTSKNNKHLTIDIGNAVVDKNRQTSLIIANSPFRETNHFFDTKEIYRAYKSSYEGGKRTKLTTLTRISGQPDVVRSITF